MALEDPLQLTWGRWLTPIDSFQHINLPFQVKVRVIFFPTFIFFLLYVITTGYYSLGKFVQQFKSQTAFKNG